jgi:hypothetical protein
MSEHHDEHGPVRDVDPEYGPEWWALGVEYCQCGHHYDAHLIQKVGPNEAIKGACIGPSCECSHFRPLDNQ